MVSFVEQRAVSYLLRLSARFRGAGRRSLYLAVAVLFASSWLVVGWPQILNFPPGLRKASAADTTIYITSGSSWTVPSDWNASSNKVECVGSGGNGASAGRNRRPGAGGGGGAYSYIVNAPYTVGSNIAYTIATGGSASDTFFNGTSVANADLSCAGGQNAADQSAGAGGLAASSVPSANALSGGAGGSATDSNGRPGGGGGGAAGPNGTGAKGGNGANGANDGAGGGGGADNGSAGVNGNTNGNGGNGGNGGGGSGGGSGGNGADGANGTSNSGGGGGGGAGGSASVSGYDGGSGSSDQVFDSTHGAGAGGGGGGGANGTSTPSGGNGGDGATYGGGGGGGGGGNSGGSNGSAGSGGQGLFKITYSPISAPHNVILYSSDGSSQIAFDKIKLNSTTPLFRVSAEDSANFNRFQIEMNTLPDFSGTSYTQTFSGTYVSGSKYNLQTTGTLGLPSTDNSIYYVRVRASNDGGSSWGNWSAQAWSYSYTSVSGDPYWYSTSDAQFSSDSTFVGTAGNGSGGVQTSGVQTISQVGSPAATTSSTATSSPTASLPSGIAKNDTLLAWIVCNTNCSLNSIAGWSQIGTTLNNGTDSSVALLYRQADGTESSTWSFTNLFTGSERNLIVVSGWHGVDSTNPIDKNAQKSDTGTSMLGPAITPDVDKAMILQFLGTDPANTAYAGSPDASGTEIYDSADSSAYMYAAMQSYLQPAKASVGLNYDSLTNDTYGAFQIALNPAPYTSGYVLSAPIKFSDAPGESSWLSAQWDADLTNGNILLQIYYTNSTTCDTLVPESALYGNATGFGHSEINLTRLNTSTYNEICLKASLTNNSSSPVLNDWTLKWSSGTNGLAPSMDQVLRGGEWFNGGSKQPFDWLN